MMTDESGVSSRAEYQVEPTALRVCDVPERLRPREEMDRLGVQNVADDVLIAIILRSGVRGRNVIDLARQLIVEHGSLGALANCSMEELMQTRGLGRVKAQVLAAALELGRRLTQEATPVNAVVRTPGDVVRLLGNEARSLDREHFWVIKLDAKSKLKGPPSVVSTGILDASLVHPREIFREAIRSATAAVVLAHNHPSGDPSPSAEDIRITKQLVDAGRVIGIRVVDHVIIGRNTGGAAKDFLSFRESGLVSFDA